MTARHHHYLSQCYLKGFSKGGSKNSTLTVIDFERQRTFSTKPKRIGGKRDFNRIDIEGFDQNEIENALSEFEGRAAAAIREVTNKKVFEGDAKKSLLNLIAMFAIRSPKKRSSISSEFKRSAEIFSEMLLSSEEQWEAQMSHLKQSDPSFEVGLTYSEVKEFFDKKEYSIEVEREYLIGIEMKQVESILPFLFERKWVLLERARTAGSFITSDNPVALNWVNPGQVPNSLRQSLGFGLSETEVYFPISQDLALIGTFEGQGGHIAAQQDVVAACNTKLLYSFYNQIYANNLEFDYFYSERRIAKGKKLVKYFSS